MKKNLLESIDSKYHKEKTFKDVLLENRLAIEFWKKLDQLGLENCPEEDCRKLKKDLETLIAYLVPLGFYINVDWECLMEKKSLWDEACERAKHLGENMEQK